MPRLRAAASPALTRSTMIECSKCAIAPSTLRSRGARGVARRRVDALPWHDQCDPVRSELAEQLHKMTQTAAETVQIVAKHDVDLPGANRLHELIEPLARDLASGKRISNHLDILPVVSRAILSERCKLRIGGLLIGRDPCVNNDSLLHTVNYAHGKRTCTQNNCLVCG
jgi:hypothetical protein